MVACTCWPNATPITAKKRKQAKQNARETKECAVRCKGDARLGVEDPRLRVLERSAIPKAGRGLATTVARRKGERLAEFGGRVDRQATHEGYAMAMLDGKFLHAERDKTGLAQLANACRKSDIAEGTCRGNNARLAFSSATGRFSLKAIRNLRANEEIFVSYGAKYWRPLR